MLTGDYNARSSSWWSGDITTRVGKELEALTSTAGYSQLIDKPTHFFNGGSSCIDLIFCNKPEFVTEYGIDYSLFHTCHHHIIFVKVSSKIFLPPAYEGEVWDYKKANIDSIQKSISLFNWERAFNNLSVSEKVNVLSSTLVNIFHNNIPNKIVKCSYKDPPWITKLIKSKLRYKAKLTTKCYQKGQDALVLDKLMDVSRESSDLIISIIKSLDSKKAHGVDNISIRMIKLCGDSIIVPLTLIFEDCIDKVIFPDQWKLANVVPGYKKKIKEYCK